MRNNERLIKWGDIYTCDFGSRPGAVKNGNGYAVILQADRGKYNIKSSTVIVAPITFALKKQGLHSHITLNRKYGLDKEAMIMLEQLTVIDKKDCLGKYIGSIDDKEKIAEIKQGIKYTMGIPVKPYEKRVGLVLSLCPECRKEMLSEPGKIIKRFDPLQANRNICDCCGSNYGYEYLVMNNARSKNTEEI